MMMTASFATYCGLFALCRVKASAIDEIFDASSAVTTASPASDSNNDYIMWIVSVSVSLFLLCSIIMCIYKVHRAAFWSKVENARSRLQKGNNTTQTTAASPWARRRTMDDLVASALTRNNGTSRFPGFPACDTYEVQYMEDGWLFRSTAQLYFKKVHHIVRNQQTGAISEEYTLWKIAGDGTAGVVGPFDIVEGYVDGSGHAYWVEKQRALVDEGGGKDVLHAISQGEFDFRTNSYKGFWEKSNGVFGTYLRFQGTRPFAEATARLEPFQDCLVADYASIIPAFIIDDDRQSEAKEATPLLSS